jgi:hypothetical protein
VVLAAVDVQTVGDVFDACAGVPAVADWADTAVDAQKT